jgi:hypothetical protein
MDDDDDLEALLDRFDAAMDSAIAKAQSVKFYVDGQGLWNWELQDSEGRALASRGVFRTRADAERDCHEWTGFGPGEPPPCD